MKNQAVITQEAFRLLSNDIKSQTEMGNPQLGNSLKNIFVTKSLVLGLLGFIDEDNGELSKSKGSIFVHLDSDGHFHAWPANLGTCHDLINYAKKEMLLGEDELVEADEILAGFNLERAFKFVESTMLGRSNGFHLDLIRITEKVRMQVN